MTPSYQREMTMKKQQLKKKLATVEARLKEVASGGMDKNLMFDLVETVASHSYITYFSISAIDKLTRKMDLEFYLDSLSYTKTGWKADSLGTSPDSPITHFAMFEWDRRNSKIIAYIKDAKTKKIVQGSEFHLSVKTEY